MEPNELLIQIKKDVDEIKKNILTSGCMNQVSDKWIPRSTVMEFFSYGSTQMSEFEKIAGVVVAKIGKRKFINRDSINKLLDSNIIKL